MGGFGSGEYRRGRAKTRVESCLRFGIGDFPCRMPPPSAGTLIWRNGQTVTDLVVFDTQESETGPYLTLHYRLGDAASGGLDGVLPRPPELHDAQAAAKEVHIPVRLQATRPGFGGKCWWFTCPLTVSGVACNRRAGKLYLPPGGRYFGCRHCYDLTYRSSQRAHQTERAIASAERLAARIERLDAKQAGCRRKTRRAIAPIS